VRLRTTFAVFYIFLVRKRTTQSPYFNEKVSTIFEGDADIKSVHYFGGKQTS